ncbi:MAG: hypothetical protein AAB724_02420, partial [Patescibacteria group bacterium]
FVKKNKRQSKRAPTASTTITPDFSPVLITPTNLFLPKPAKTKTPLLNAMGSFYQKLGYSEIRNLQNQDFGCLTLGVTTKSSLRQSGAL